MADNNTEVATQSSSATDIDLLINSDATAEELSQNGFETTSDIKQIETESSESDETDEEMIPSKGKKNRKCAVLDSDSDDDAMQEPEKTLPENLDDTDTKAYSDETRIENELHTNDSNQSDEGSVKKNMKRSRIKPVWNSEHEDDSSDYEMYTKTSFSKDGLADKIKSSLSAKSVNKKKLTKKQHSSSESENGNSSDSENEDKDTSKIKLAWNSEGDSDGSAEGNDSNKEKNNSIVSPKARKLRKKPVEEIQKIHSESQRMVRESTVCLPYHKPKQRSLLEFLNRKRVNNEDCAKPSPRNVGPVVQVLEDRVKEIEEFFKSESEESENETEKVDTVLLHDKEVLPPNPELSSAVDSNPTLTLVDNVPDVPEKILLESENPQSPTTSHNVEMSSPLDSLEDIETTNNSAAAPQDMAGSSNSVDKATNEVKSSADLISDGSNDSWLDFSSVFSHKEKVENIKRLSIAKVNKPTLHGRPGQLLDFDLESEATPDQKEKVNNLIERFVQQVTNTKKTPKKKDIQISIVHKVMNADGQLELKRDVLSVPVENNSSECASAGRRQLLRDSLRQSISAKRAVDRMKKIESQQIENEDFQSDGKLDSEPEEEILSDEPETDMDEDEDEEDNGYERKKKKKKKKNMFVDEEAEDSDENNMKDDEEDDDQDDEDTVKVKSKTIYHSAGQSDEDETSKPNSQSDDIVFASKSDLKLSLSKSSGRFSSLEGLTPNLNESDDSSEDLIPKLRDTQNDDASNVEELLGLCSGKFPDSTPGGNTQKSQLNEMVDDDDSEEDFKPFSRIIPMDDDDEDSNSSPIKLQVENDGDEPESAPVLLDDEEEKSKPIRRKRAVICLSDDEDENEENDEEMHEEEREFRGLTDFFEDEAELSGSEVGSGDEREDEVDDWEEEEGDKEDIDENEVREQIGRAHMKTLLDQDQRDVRLFQELFLEDGDLHSDGGGRQRQFRWKNADGEETEDNRPKTQEEEAEEAAEEQDDLTWRKMRSEREKWLQQQKSQQMQEEKKDVPLVMKRNGKMVKVNTKTASNAVEKADSSSAVAPAVNLKQFISPKKNIAATVRRGSFLRRSEKDLSAIASLTKSVLPVQAPKAGSNFVFASITPERPPIQERRKVKQEVSCGSSDQNPAPAKKAKVSLKAKSIFSYF